MKITILSTAFPFRGGISNFTSLLYKELNKQHDVKVVTFKRQYPAIFFPGSSQLEDGDTPAKIPTEQLVDSVNPLNWIYTGKKIKNDNPDLLIISYFMPYFAPCFGTISRQVKKNRKTKILALCHNIIPHEKKIGDNLLTGFFFGPVDYFVVLSRKVQDDLLKLLPKAKNRILEHPVYSIFGEPVNKKSAKDHLNITAKNVILFFGFIRDYKGLDILFEAVSLLKDRLDIKLIVAGEFYSNEQRYHDLIRELNIEEQIILRTRFIPASDVKYYFSACDAVILPYRDATQSGIVQVAMNFRKPVIATNVGGLGEIVIDNKTGFIVDKEKPQTLADSIERFYTGKKEAEFVTNIINVTEKYSWNRFVDGMLELIKE